MILLKNILLQHIYRQLVIHYLILKQVKKINSPVKTLIILTNKNNFWGSLEDLKIFLLIFIICGAVFLVKLLLNNFESPDILEKLSSRGVFINLKKFL